MSLHWLPSVVFGRGVEFHRGSGLPKLVFVIAMVAPRRLVRLHHLLHLGLVHVLFAEEYVELLRFELQLTLQESVELHRLGCLLLVQVVCELNLLPQSFHILLAGGYAGLHIHYGGHQHVVHCLKVRVTDALSVRLRVESLGFVWRTLRHLRHLLHGLGLGRRG